MAVPFFFYTQYPSYSTPLRTFQSNDSRFFTFVNDAGRTVFTITNEGDVILGEGMTPNDASRRLWEHLKSTFPQNLATGKLLKAEKDLATVRGLLSDKAKEVETITRERDSLKSMYDASVRDFNRVQRERDMARADLADMRDELRQVQRDLLQADKVAREVKEHLESIFTADGFAEVVESLAEARKWWQEH